MNKPRWTEAQLQAITACGGTVLVSAAAGSGKTAVLVERVIRLITGGESPCGIDEMLIVTFTNAAAAEMRERIGAALSALIAEQPENQHLQRQQMLLPGARICTIDSFCKDLLKEHFHTFDIPQDFKILEQAQLEVLEEAALSSVLENAYQKGSQGFLSLVELLSSGRDDRALSSAVKKLYGYIMAHPFPMTWLRDKSRMYASAQPVGESPWGRVLLSYVREALSYSAELLETGAALLLEDELLAQKTAPGFQLSAGHVKKLIQTVESGDWDETIVQLNKLSFERFVTPKGYGEHPAKLMAAQKRTEAKKRVEECKLLLCASEEEHREDLAALAPLAAALGELVEAYNQKLMELKLQNNGLSFSDIEQFALRLLVRETSGGWERTDLAKELSSQYREILVDEYQDTNRAQDMLFSAISRQEENLFLVGDVKQSIYRFRQAMPEIFLERREALPSYDGAHCPARILLDRNFRSRKGIAQMINFVFSNLMSKEVGELTYDESEALVPAAEYPPADEPECEVHLVKGEEREPEESTDAYEARYLAGLVNQMIQSGTTVTVKGVQRPVRYEDICVLFRSASNHIPAYVAEFAKWGIPTWAQAADGLFAAPEVAQVLALLRVLDNPMQDVPLLTLLFSPLFGFTPDDLADIRMPDRSVPLYTALVQSGKQGNEKAAAVLSDLERMRTLAATMPVGELLRRLYEELELFALVSVLPNPEERIANLQLLKDYAQRFERAGVKGLAGFVRFLDKLEQQDGSLPGACVQGGENAVRFMSIHHSKGLEFPVCILAGTSRRFNTQGLRENLLLHPQLGIGLKRRDTARAVQFQTVPYQALKLSIQTAELSEYLRVLYVAMTRAREKLLLVATVDAPEKKLKKLASRLTPGKPPAPFQVRGAGSDSDWLLTCALLHPDAVELRAMAGATQSLARPAGFPLRVVVAAPAAVLQQTESSAWEIQADAQLYGQIKERLEYHYPYASLAGVVAKRGASELGEAGFSPEFFASSQPAFLSKQGLTPAERGTALHKYMQFCRYETAVEQPEKELERLMAEGYLDTVEGASIPIEKIAAFFSSPLARRMLQSGKRMREQKFTVMVPASRYAAAADETLEGESILIQGIADCVFIEDEKLVIVDYKTDKVASPDTLVERYYTQMEIYADALTKMLDLPLGEIWLYSFALGQAVPVVLEDRGVQLCLNI